MKPSSVTSLPSHFLTAVALGLAAPALAFAGEYRPPSPDTIELTGKIREDILRTSRTTAPGDPKTYTETVKKNGAQFAMVPTPGGEFLMGSPATEKERRPDEGPQVKINLQPFWMSATEITWDAYMPYMVTADPRWKDGTRKTLNPDEPPVDSVSIPTAPYSDMTFNMGEAGYPAISMTEHAANKFCQWLSAQTGHFYRLPTEAEWEYAARAGTTTTWSFGDDPAKLDDYAWHFANSDGKTQPVGKMKPNPWGLFDMHGNVAEWTLDQYDSAYHATLASLVQSGAILPAWNKPVTLYPRSVRGGSWDDDPKDLRSAARRASKDTWKNMDPEIPKSLWYHTTAQFLGMRIVRPLHIPTTEEMHDAWNLGTKNDVK
jgi:formylglycine-generating enzyme required for sulfatase activity